MNRLPADLRVRRPPVRAMVRVAEKGLAQGTHRQTKVTRGMQRYSPAPHQGHSSVSVGAPNAALLIDFDNVTMGIRSDLTRQLKDLLNSDIIKGKVAVQRAYADWRRYAQYIVPLSEASVDLIFAPAYGSSKKNATDIRLAIDALELVFTRPEIGVFILLSGDSDFSSLVLKLKEYGKYVIGVGLRESASDLLVQNCDEYFSYSALTGLTRAGEEETVSAVSPWELAQRAVQQMADDNDVMRSDRMKQVMLELDPSFDEAQLGYSKFNRFLTEAASKNKLALRKLDNGQYEVQPFEVGEKPAREERSRGGRGRREPRRDETRREEPRREETRASESQAAARAAAPEPQKPMPRPASRERKAEDLKAGYELVQRAIRELTSGDQNAARDSDIKRQMLELEPGWDESEIGFTKFSRFLRQAHDAEVIDLQKSGEGYYEARLPRGAARAAEKPRARSDREDRENGEERGGRDRGGRGGRDRGGRDRDRDRGDRDRGGRGAARGERDRAGVEDAAVTTERSPAAAAQEVPDQGAGRDEAPARDRSRRPERDAEPAIATASAAVDEAKAPSDNDNGPGDGETERAGSTGSEDAGSASETAAGAGARKSAAESKPTPSPRGLGRGRTPRRGAPEGPPPLLPGQAVGSAGGSTSKAASRGSAEASEDAPTSDEARPSSRRERVAAAAVEATSGEGDGARPAASPAATPSTPSTSSPSATASSSAGATAGADATSARPAPGAGANFDATALGLPTDSAAVIRYLSNSYPGVGQKTAETLIGAFGAERVFHGLHADHDRVRDILGSGRRTEALLEAWQKDYRRRTTAGSAGSTAPTGGSAGG